METYNLDPMVENYFLENNALTKYNKLISLLEQIEEFLDLQIFIPQDKCIRLSELESESINIVNEELDPSDVINRVMELYKDRILYFLRTIGITVEEEIYLYQLEELFSTLNLIFDIEQSQIDIIEGELNTEKDDTTILVEILNDYSSENFFTLITNVQSSVIEKLQQYFKTKSKFNTVDIDNNLITNLAVIIHKDSLFSNSILYNKIIQGELLPNNLTELLPSFFTAAEQLKGKEHYIPYELYCLCLLSKIPKGEYVNTILEEVDLSLISYLEEDENTINALIQSFKTLISNTIGDISNEEE